MSDRRILLTNYLSESFSAHSLKVAVEPSRVTNGEYNLLIGNLSSQRLLSVLGLLPKDLEEAADSMLAVLGLPTCHELRNRLSELRLLRDMQSTGTADLLAEETRDAQPVAAEERA